MKQPTAPNLYPEMPVEDGQNYRLQKISEIEKTLIAERDTRQSLYKKYKRGMNITDGVDTFFISSSIILAGIGIAIPILLPLQIAAIVSGGIGACIKLVRRKLNSKAKKHYKIKTIASTKLNSVKDLISRVLNDGKITEDEFGLILNELDKYNNLKSDIHTAPPNNISNEERKKLIEEGKAQALTELKKKIEDA